MAIQKKWVAFPFLQNFIIKLIQYPFRTVLEILEIKLCDHFYAKKPDLLNDMFLNLPSFW